ncbi:hypothetical protein [Mycoplasma zalophi]|uniref:hypothetical protein n=1 Tax=Mycoplasma zalophi TaxID=191287 RepID=UPI001C0FB57B|nr:hypothetical protein [Mycoplasma zalophi]MBU4690924.1 hypothetical protein [Mycoplasma zalophi]
MIDKKFEYDSEKFDKYGWIFYYSLLYELCSLIKEKRWSKFIRVNNDDIFANSGEHKLSYDDTEFLYIRDTPQILQSLRPYWNESFVDISESENNKLHKLIKNLKLNKKIIIIYDRGYDIENFLKVLALKLAKENYFTFLFNGFFSIYTSGISLDSWYGEFETLLKNTNKFVLLDIYNESLYTFGDSSSSTITYGNKLFEYSKENYIISIVQKPFAQQFTSYFDSYKEDSLYFILNLNIYETQEYNTLSFKKYSRNNNYNLSNDNIINFQKSFIANRTFENLNKTFSQYINYLKHKNIANSKISNEHLYNFWNYLNNQTDKFTTYNALKKQVILRFENYYKNISFIPFELKEQIKKIILQKISSDQITKTKPISVLLVNSNNYINDVIYDWINYALQGEKSKRISINFSQTTTVNEIDFLINRNIVDNKHSLFSLILTNFNKPILIKSINNYISKKFLRIIDEGIIENNKKQSIHCSSNLLLFTINNKNLEKILDLNSNQNTNLNVLLSNNFLPPEFITRLTEIINLTVMKKNIDKLSIIRYIIFKYKKQLHNSLHVDVNLDISIENYLLTIVDNFDDLQNFEKFVFRKFNKSLGNFILNNQLKQTIYFVLMDREIIVIDKG